MKIYILSLVLVSSIFTQVLAQTESEQTTESIKVPHTGFDDPKPNEYILIDPKGSIARSECPFTCEDRAISKENCKTWKSKSNSKECYVQDLRIASEAIK